ncbi:hypothetical protein JMN32_06630 [Fulvivirga sp. 29W222]|uniref:DUF5004 domain-containing protein n=1 Tax=Fulvivirga marina TaxID=2494733 RepID=A0A937FZY9_9BACT|nr:hypothetical protein [Fulvivirga marina]MBL6445976.1 hypothetical protein [Fulvivirga marina]
MKNLTYLFSAVILLVVLTTIGCKKDDDPGLSEEEQQLEALAGTWVATTVNDGVQDRQDYDGFTLTINKELTYSTAGGPNLLPMPEAGSFVFGTNVKSNIVIDPTDANIPATYSIAADGATLTLSFTYSGSGFANTRTNSVNGSWTFTFAKQ